MAKTCPYGGGGASRDAPMGLLLPARHALGRARLILDCASRFPGEAEDRMSLAASPAGLKLSARRSVWWRAIRFITSVRPPCWASASATGLG